MPVLPAWQILLMLPVGDRIITMERHRQNSGNGAGETLKGRLLILDALGMQWRTVKLAKDPACAVCARVAA